MVCDRVFNEENLSTINGNGGNALAVKFRKLLLEPQMSYMVKID